MSSHIRETVTVTTEFGYKCTYLFLSIEGNITWWLFCSCVYESLQKLTRHPRQDTRFERLYESSSAIVNTFVEMAIQFVWKWWLYLNVYITDKIPIWICRAKISAKILNYLYGMLHCFQPLTEPMVVYCHLTFSHKLQWNVDQNGKFPFKKMLFRLAAASCQSMC